MTIEDDIVGLKRRASFFISQRRKDLDLYQLLADTLAICERASLEGEVNRLKAEFLARRKDEGRRVYFEGDPDVYLIVGRAVFEPEINRAASWRYTATLREASKLQLRSGDLVEYLRTNGGVNALFKARPVEARTSTTKVLNLTRPITVPKEQNFKVTLRRNSRGFFDVMEGPSG